MAAAVSALVMFDVQDGHSSRLSALGNEHRDCPALLGTADQLAILVQHAGLRMRGMAVGSASHQEHQTRRVHLSTGKLAVESFQSRVVSSVSQACSHL